MKKRLSAAMKELSWLERTWLLAPIALWFSYQPLVRFGQDATLYYELSVTLVYLFVLALIGIPSIWRARVALMRTAAAQLTGAFVGLSLLSLLWTENLARGILTAGVVGLLYLVFLAAIAEHKRLRKLLPSLATLLVASAVAVSIVAFLQVLAGIWLPRAGTLLCAGCTADQFGFVRPNAFAVEPQFLGSLLLAPLLTLLHVFLQGRRDGKIIVNFLLISAALFMTLSRGAIFAFALGALLLILLNWRKARRIAAAGALLMTAFVLTLVVQGTAAALNPRVNVTFYEAVSASVNQLSLGVISLPEEQPAVAENNNDPAPAFEGYVEESTTTRLSLTQQALGVWGESPGRLLLGAGLGGSGVAIHEKYPDTTGAREIVQNEYVEILLEYGVVGLALFIAILVGFLRSTRHEKWAWAFLLAYGVQWGFFSGYPNALHVYLVLISLYAAFQAGPTSARLASAKPTRPS